MFVYGLASKVVRLLQPLCFKANTGCVIIAVRELTKSAVGNTDAFSKHRKTHFGFQIVNENEKAEAVHSMFKNISSVYDMMNDMTSLGLHRVWKDQFVKTLGPTPGMKLLDVAGGTGDIAIRVVDYLKTLNWSTEHFQKLNKQSNDGIPSTTSHKLSGATRVAGADDTHVVVCDITSKMMEFGKEKAKRQQCNQGLSWICGDAEQLPVDDNTFDAYTIAFGIRNVVHIDKALSEAYRVLRPGGRFLCLEFSHVDNSLVHWIYDHYSFQVIPVLGQLLAGDWKSYQYLVESIRKFPDQETFADMMRSCGFSLVQYENLSFGITAIHSGIKL